MMKQIEHLIMAHIAGSIDTGLPEYIGANISPVSERLLRACADSVYEQTGALREEIDESAEMPWKYTR